MQVHGSLGLSDEMPFVAMVMNARHLGIADGPTEVHKITLARTLLSRTTPVEGPFPSRHIPARRKTALERYADIVSAHGQARV
jgi:acyl-CoA dehydrogenase